MIIGTNISATYGSLYLNRAQANEQKWMQQLSSGQRINQAGDDAAGTAVSSRLDKIIRGNAVGIRNAQDGVSLVQTGEGAMQSLEQITQRMRELAVQSANGTYVDTTDRTNMDGEFQQLQKQFVSIVDNTNFNGVSLLNAAAAATPITLQVGSESADTMDLQMSDLSTTNTYTAANDVLTQATAKTALTALDADLDAINTARATMGAYQNRLDYTTDNLNTNITNTTSAKSRITDADMAQASSQLAKYKVLSQSSVAMIAQANQMPQMVQQLLQ